MVGVPRYLRCDLLQPADVILTRSRRKPSGVVAAATRGPYSHAAIVVDNSHKFEALDDGLGFTPLELARCELKDGELRLLADVSEYPAILVLRHPSLENGCPADLGARVRDTVVAYLADQYPNLDALRFTVVESALGSTLIGAALRLANTFRHEKVLLPGPFCSMLVALVYEALDLPLFESKRNPRTVSPNALLRSKLKARPEMICAATATARNDEALMHELNDMHRGLDRKTILKVLVKMRLFNLEAQKALVVYKETGDQLAAALLAFVKRLLSEDAGKKRGSN